MITTLKTVCRGNQKCYNHFCNVAAKTLQWWRLVAERRSGMSEKLGRAPKVLVVGNQQTTGPLWVSSLQQQKLNVLLEADPAHAIQRCEVKSPDLIILDIHLPEAALLELVRGLRAEILNPILMLSPVRSEEFILETYNAGV